MHVRRADRNDADAVIALGMRAHAESDYASTPFSEHRARAAFGEFSHRSDATVLLLCDDTEVCGILVGIVEPAYFTNTHEASETLFYIDPEYRKAENARRLIEAFEQWARYIGAATVSLSVSQLKNAKAVSAMYGRMGYPVSAFVHRRAL